ncbi:MAG: P-loop NTPase fold protein [Patescibacteria group bacterium]
MAQENLIPIDVPKGDFEYFLKIEANKRIFFSGKFGVGKTFFLQRFFEEHKDEYDVYHLFPVRYQITSNENIIDFLKYDVLIELLKKNPTAFQKSEVNGIGGWASLFSAFFKEKASFNGFLQSVISSGENTLALSPDPFFQIVGRLGRPLKDLLDIDKEFQVFKKKYLAGDKQGVDEFFKEIEKENTNTVSTDYLSHLLRQKISELKGDKKSVLVLDDFERIDPEHIFRILNVLSAHMEGDEENGFGFDHVIIVGDIRNVKSIFHHKYGESTEFFGYFDKFFTVRPFYFDNKQAIAERIPNLLKQVKCDDEGLKESLSESGVTKNLMEEVLKRAFAIEEINLRQLYKPVTHSFPEVRKGVYTKDVFSDQRNQCIDTGIKLLIALFGDKDDFLRVLKKIRDGASSSPHEGMAWFYAEYSNSMLRRLLRLKSEAKHSWLKKYPVIGVQDQQSSSRVNVYLEGNAQAHARFFYDTFVEYIEREKYQKVSIYEYEH